MTRYHLSLILSVLPLGCFTDIVPDSDPVPPGTTATDGEDAPPLPVESTSTADVSTSSTSVEGTGSTSSTGAAPRCGDGVQDTTEGCDDGNDVPGDGCNANCEIEQRACAPGVSTLGEDLEGGIGVCKDATNSTCEQDFRQLCAPGWHLCSATEHARLNDGVLIDLGDLTAVGVIRCRTLGGSGHYTSHDFNVDGPDSCEVGSSRVDCPTNLGCNESMHAALCCAPIPSCGNGVVDDPREECDDGDVDDVDGCSSECANRLGSGPHC